MQLYCRIGEYEKAKALANDQNSIAISKELLLPLSAFGEERAKYHSEQIMALLSHLQFSIGEAIALCPAVASSAHGRQLLLSVIHLYEAIFEDGRCGKWHWVIGQQYLTLVRYEMDNNGSLDVILQCFDKAFDHHKAYEQINMEDEYQYSAPLISALPKIYKGEIAPFNNDFWEKELRTYHSDIVDEIRRNPKSAECFA